MVKAFIVTTIITMAGISVGTGHFGQEGSFGDKSKCPSQVRRDSIQSLHNENDANKSPFDINSLPLPEVELSNIGGMGDDLN